MLVCPNCKNEYREGFTTCTECECDLVDELSAKEQPPFDEVQEEMYNKAFYGENEEAIDQESIESEDMKKHLHTGTYRNSAQRAEDNKSSAWTLLFVGGIGFIGTILIMTGVIPLQFGGMTKYMVYGVMLAMFVLFIIMGMVSLRNSKIFAQKAESENSLSDAMSTWCKEHLHKEALDSELFVISEEELTEEIKYFKRIELLKKIISDKFMNLDEGFLDAFIDNIYEEIFGS